MLRRSLPLSCAALLALAGPCLAGGRTYEVDLDASAEKGGLQMGVKYVLWLPDGVETVRGVIVHQHGCGVGACKGGETAAYDLHWQALAKKHGCALMGPSYRQAEKQNCRLWCDPRNGSEKAFLSALARLAKETKHPELEAAPWCLWGHSGGGFWASLMHAAHPERTVAVWLRSGTAFVAWQKGEVPEPKLSDAVYRVPVVCNPGVKEKDNKQFAGAWNGAVAMFEAYRAKGAPIALAPDPRTGHECGDSRYLAIPYFDACLTARLPRSGTKLLEMDAKKAWLAKPLSRSAVPASAFGEGADKAVWLPDERTAKAWAEYVETGAVSDKTPPPAPTAVRAKQTDAGVELTWEAEADFESGLREFAVLLDGKEVGRLPRKPAGRFGRPLFQSLSYHDTPERPMPAMRFVDEGAKAGKAEYRVIAVNGVGLRSRPSAPAK